MDQDHLNPFNVRDDLKLLELEEIQMIQSQGVLDYSVAVFNLINDFNIATVIRNACIFGARTLYVIGRRKYDRRGTVGAHHYVDIQYVESYRELLDHQLVALEVKEHVPASYFHKHGFLKDVSIFPWEPGDCLLVGLEGQGIPEEVFEHVHGVAYIEQFGVMRSLNAGVASGIAMHAISSSLHQQQRNSDGSNEQD